MSQGLTHRTRIRLTSFHRISRDGQPAIRTLKQFWGDLYSRAQAQTSSYLRVSIRRQGDSNVSPCVDTFSLKWTIRSVITFGLNIAQVGFAMEIIIKLNAEGNVYD